MHPPSPLLPPFPCIPPGAVHPTQLALATLLQQLLPGLASPPQLYDPAFSPLDAALLQHLGMEVVGRDEGGRRPVDEPTLFYLPHCEVRA